MPRHGFLVMLVAFAIVLQNTCPYGLAERTAAASPYIQDCPMKNHHEKGAEEDGSSDVRDVQKHFKMFNLMDCFIDYRAQLIAEDSTVGHTTIKYDEDFIDLPIKPPMHTA